MSVLAGTLHLDGAPAGVDELVWCSEGNNHWDQTGAHAEGPVAFGWQYNWTTPEAVDERLPVESPDRRFVVSYAGRVDNRDELIGRYAATRTASDGDLLAAALDREGLAGLRHCIGDFALAAWDRVDRRLFLARDAIGLRPLFYVHNDNQLIWSTDFRALRRGPANASRPNAGFLAEYLSGSVVSGHETVFDQIHRVRPGHALTATPGRQALTISEYWTPPTALPPRRPDSDLIDEFRERFAAAVTACLRVRGPVGAELSGGLDSSSIVALTRELTGRGPDTYSMVFPGDLYAPDGERLDETEFIEVMIAAAGGRSFRYDPRTTNADDALRVLRAHGDVPDWPNSDLVRWPLMRAAAADGHRVVLTGIGGDQWLTGSVARLPALLGAGRLVEAWRFLRSSTGPVGLEAKRLPMLKRLAAASTPRVIKRTFRKIRAARPWPPWLRDAFVSDSNLAARLRDQWSRVPHSADAVLRDSLCRLLGSEDALAREAVFRSADDAGVEARHPFLDRRVVEFALTLPDDLRFRHGQTRFILRQAMGARLPAPIAARLDKGDGSIMVGHALRQVLAVMPLTNLCAADIGWVDGGLVRAAADPFLPGRPLGRVPQSSDLSVWNVIAVEAWLRTLT